MCVVGRVVCVCYRLRCMCVLQAEVHVCVIG